MIFRIFGLLFASMVALDVLRGPTVAGLPLWLRILMSITAVLMVIGFGMELERRGGRLAEVIRWLNPLAP